MRQMKQAPQESGEAQVRSRVLDILWIALPCFAIATASGALGWVTVARIFGFVGFSVLGWNMGQIVRAFLRRRRRTGPDRP
jgi:hypothetical protein